MLLDMSWARKITDWNVMLDEIARQDFSPVECEYLLVQSARPESLAEYLTEVRRRFGDRYIDAMKQIVALFDETHDFSDPDYQFTNYVENGELAPEFRRGLETLLAYFEPEELDAIRREAASIREAELALTSGERLRRASDAPAIGSGREPGALQTRLNP